MVLKNIKKAGMPRLIRNTQGTALTKIADEVLLHSASIITEGYIDRKVSAEDVYSGSTMLTIDLMPFCKQFPVGMEMYLVVEHLKKSIYFRLGLMRLARREAESRSPNVLLGELSTELEFRIEQKMLLIDIDVLGKVERPVTSKNGTEEAR